MAPDPEPIYFPSLDKCLTGEVLLISWKLVFSAITSSTELQNGDEATITKFIADEEVKKLLAKPFVAFPEPSPQSRAPFDTKTSAINVTPSSDARYQIKEIKEDALWLSKIAKLDEVTALRVVIIECQSRSTAQLLGPLSEDELVNIRGAAGNIKYSSPLPVSLLSHGPEPEEIQKSFDAPRSRKQRILHTYLSERRHFRKCSERLLGEFLLDFNTQLESQKGKGPATSKSWLADCAYGIFSNVKAGDLESLELLCVKSIERSLKNLESGSGWSGEEGWHEDVELDWVRSQIAETIHSMEYLWHLMIYVIGIPSSQLVLDWCRLLQAFGFFNSFDSNDESTQALFFALQSISSIVTVSMLNNENSLTLLSEVQNDTEVSSTVGFEQPFVLNYRTLSDVHAIILQAADIGFLTAGPAILAWSILLQTMQVRVENSIRILEHVEAEDRGVAIRYQNILEQIQGTVDDDAIDFLARQAVNQCRVFDAISSLSSRLGNTQGSFVSSRVGGQMRECLLTLIKGTLGIGYIPEIIEATISTLAGGKGYWDIVDSDPLLADDPVLKFLRDEDMTTSLLKAAQARYPFESLPFLQLVRALATSPSCYTGVESESILEILSNMTYFTYALPGDFADYETTQEEENNNSIRLTRTINLFEPRSKLIHGVGQQTNSFALVKADEDFSIPAGTYGRIVSESGPRVAFWFHEFSALKYFGKLLETFLRASDEVDGTTGMAVDRESVSELIGVFATILLSITRSSSTNSNWLDATGLVLQSASCGLSRNRDIITVVFDIFEEELHNQSISFASNTSLEILVSCVQFIHAILPVAPGRVWPLMARSGLLGVANGSSRLLNIVEGIELSSGQFPFLVSCCRLFESLVDEISTSALRRKSGNKCFAKFDGVLDVGSRTPDHVLSKIILSFTRYLIDVLENSSVWRFVSYDERQCLISTIGRTFEKILRYSYGIDSSIAENGNASPGEEEAKKLKGKQKTEKEKSSLMAALMLSASHIVDNFLSTSSGILRFQPLLRSYFDGMETPGCTVYRNESSLWKEQVISLLAFSKTLIRISTLLGRPSSQIEKQLFKACPLLARLYAANEFYRNPVVTLLESLVVAAANTSSEPPSLLGHLGPRTTKNFFDVLSDLDKPLIRDQNFTSIWHFLAMIVSCRQVWLAKYLLAGKTLEYGLKKRKLEKASTFPGRPLLTIALEILLKLKDIPRKEAVALLEFTALAQNFQPWVVCENPKYPEFIKAILDFAGNLPPPQLRVANLEDQIDVCYQLRIAAYIAEILAMHLFHSRQTGVSVDLKDLLPNLSYFERFATAAPHYNVSLHGLLKRNFEMRYAGCTIEDIKRTTLNDREFGIEYFYDLSLADKMLSLDQAWIGRKAGEGMRGEFGRANVNLSLVDAQIALFHSWKFLLTELSSRTSSGPDLQKMFTKVITDSLTADGQPQPPEEIFARLSRTRADLALILIQRLVHIKSSVSEMTGLLTIVWNTIRTLRGSFERPVPDGDIFYYRSLLKILFLAIRIHAERNTEATDEKMRMTLRVKQSATVTPIILDILRYVVSNGLREIVTIVHDSPKDSSPEDLALLTGIMQSCLRVSGIEACHSQIVTIMTTNDTARLALTLFSWSDNLSIDGDPIYGELSILFLLELSSIPMMAEQLAIGGILGNLSSATLISYLRRKEGVSPLVPSAGLQRCYSIWVRGILPLLLNILDSVQQAVACDVALFLNQFPILLEQSQVALDAPLLNRLADDPVSNKYITLTTCSELHSIALLTYILSGFREVLRGSVEIPDVKWNGSAVLEDVEFWLSSRALLRERIVPMGDREAQMAKNDLANGNVVTRLEEKIVVELIGIRDVISGGDNS